MYHHFIIGAGCIFLLAFTVALSLLALPYIVHHDLPRASLMLTL